MTARKKPAAKVADEAVAIEESIADAAPDVDESPEVARGELDGVAHDDGTADVHKPLDAVEESVVVDASAEPVHSPEVARGPLDATPAESVRHDNLA